jgi:signal transduction protein with GAF and PtsI domain
MLCQCKEARILLGLGFEHLDSIADTAVGHVQHLVGNAQRQEESRQTVLSCASVQNSYEAMPFISYVVRSTPSA